MHVLTISSRTQINIRPRGFWTQSPDISSWALELEMLSWLFRSRQRLLEPHQKVIHCKKSPTESLPLRNLPWPQGNMAKGLELDLRRKSLTEKKSQTRKRVTLSSPETQISNVQTGWDAKGLLVDWELSCIWAGNVTYYKFSSTPSHMSMVGIINLSY
jgi:hypothetical protein